MRPVWNTVAKVKHLQIHIIISIIQMINDQLWYPWKLWYFQQYFGIIVCYCLPWQTWWLPPPLNTELPWSIWPPESSESLIWNGRCSSHELQKSQSALIVEFLNRQPKPNDHRVGVGITRSEDSKILIYVACEAGIKKLIWLSEGKILSFR